MMGRFLKMSTSYILQFLPSASVVSEALLWCNLLKVVTNCFDQYFLVLLLERRQTTRQESV